MTVRSCPDAGSFHMTTEGYPVWKPGERFVDMNENGRWDGLDEASNMQDLNGDGHPDLLGPWVDLNEDNTASNAAIDCVYLEDSDNDGDPDCCPGGPRGRGDRLLAVWLSQPAGQSERLGTTPAPPPPGPRRAERLRTATADLVPDICELSLGDNPEAAAECALLQWTGFIPQTRSRDRLPLSFDGRQQPSPNGIPDECEFVEPDEPCGQLSQDVTVPCTLLPVPRTPVARCEFDDSDLNGRINIVEPFENFLRRWDPCIIAPEVSVTNRFDNRAHWIKVYDPGAEAFESTGVCDDPPYTVDYHDDSYIRDNYPAGAKRCLVSWLPCATDDDCSTCDECDPTDDDCLDTCDTDVCRSGVDELVAEAGGRPLIGSHDPYGKIPTGCRCPDGQLCTNGLSGYEGDPPGFVYDTGWVNLCVIGETVDYNPPDDWLNHTEDETGPRDRTTYTTKMRHAPGEPGTRRARFVGSKFTPKPAWYTQAWGDRYRVPNPDYDSSEPISVSNPLTVPAEAPDWPDSGGGENVPLMELYPDVDADNYEPALNRRYFKANAGGVNGDGTGWIGCAAGADQFIIFETGLTLPIGFETQCNAPILPDELAGETDAPEFYDGWVEHDDLASSKYHRAGDQQLGEVTSPFSNTIWGHDRGLHIPGAIPTPDGRIPAAGPLAIDIDGNNSLDGGNVLTMELLTWRRESPFNDGLAWTYELEFDNVPYRFHPYASPKPLGANLGFRDYNLDGLVDLGESRFTGSNTEWTGPNDDVYVPSSDNYLVDSNPTTPNDGSRTKYPFNRRRMMEDCVEALDRTTDFDDWLDQVALATFTCNRGTPGTPIPRNQRYRGVDDSLFARGLQSGIILLPPDSHEEGNFPFAPSFYAVHTQDGDDPDTTFPLSGTERIHWDLFFHDLPIKLTTERQLEGDFQTGYAAHEYLHTWESFPDLYDYDGFTDELVYNTPIGAFDIMAHSFGKPPLRLVHSVPILKEKPCTEWIEPVDLAAELTPGVLTSLTIPAYEDPGDRKVYFLENESRLGERLYFYSVGAGRNGSFDELGYPPNGPIDGGLPGEGMLILHTDVGSNPEALPAQQTTEPFQYRIVQADGLGELEAGIAPYGDDGDLWPGSTGATEFNFDSVPRAVWYTANRWTGIDVQDVVPGGNGSTKLTISWTPTTLPSLRFVTPPGGESINSEYRINFDATDVFGGTTIRMYHTHDRDNVAILSGGANFIGETVKTTPGTNRLSMDWDLSSVPDGRYFFFAKLIPGVGADGTEIPYTEPRAGRNNRGAGSLTINAINITGNKTRSESWVVTCVSKATQDWVVTGSLSQPEPEDNDPVQDPWPHATTGQQYTSVGGEVKFTINGGPFDIGDTFTFTTTGITAASRGVTVSGHRIRSSPTAKILASPLAGPPPLEVEFDARTSTDPEGQPLQYRWDFGDGSLPATGSMVTHTFTDHGTFTVILTATNTVNGRLDETSVDIEVTNNSPIARISASPSSGAAPLTVNFDGGRSSDAETGQNDLVYQWDFGDGTSANDAGTPGVLITPQKFYTKAADGTTCTASSPCTFVATLTVTDDGGKSDSDTMEIHVGNTAPVANIRTTATRGSSPLEVQFSAKDSTDAENQALTVTWTWGDGSADVTYSTDGPAGSDGWIPHTFTLPSGSSTASFHVTAVVKDSLGATSAWPGVTIVVSEAMAGTSDPVAAFTIDPDPPILDEEFEVDGRLSFDRPSRGLPDRFAWDWGDGTATGSGSTAKHTYTEAGQYTITLTVFDDENPPNTGSRSRTVRVEDTDEGPDPTTNRRPNAVINTNQTQGYAGVTEFVLDGRNSTDPDGDALTYLWNIPGEQLRVGSTTAIVFDEAGSYNVTLTVTDEESVSDDASVTLVVASNEGNQAPLAFIGTGPRTGTAPFTLTFNGENSYDPDGDPLTMTWEVMLDDQLISEPTGSVITYTFGSEGVYSIVLRVDDGRGGIATTEPEVVRVTARVDDGNTNTNDNTNDNGSESPIRDSADQRPASFCGIGMLTSMFASLLGLSMLRLTRRRFRR